MSVRILVGDALERLRTLPDASVHTCVTSPPYYGLRDYGTGRWDGGNPACGHKGRPKPRNDTSGSDSDLAGQRRFASTRGTQPAKAIHSVPVKDVCVCGARRVDRQIGLELSPDEYVARIVEVFDEVHRVLRHDGTLWLNIGDSYANDGKWGGESGGKQAYLDDSNRKRVGREKRITGLKPKDLIGVPWMLAFALRSAGWWLRADIIWSKPNPMPESVTDRPTKSHEYVFLLTKSEKYYYDHAAVMEPIAATSVTRLSHRAHAGAKSNGKMKAVARRSGNKSRKFGESADRPGSHLGRGVPWEGTMRNRRSVWTVTTRPFKGAHFATFPPALIEPCILAGAPAGGVVLDPFGGAGTTALVADRLGRDSVLVELNPAYAEIARVRIIAENPLLATVDVEAA